MAYDPYAMDIMHVLTCLTPFYFQIENRDFYICALFFRLNCTDYVFVIFQKFLSLQNKFNFLVFFLSSNF